ncbi:type VI secretion system-associated FHA domain protein [Terricaulis sp.]|uniref:type VI secretion system-associated FHA domain protein n=1 Tax=Terricaulis sp. TaxID=2768686 RepID=UPI002AC432C9|nr:type VI secretion system-associated FHA domain protein [Terricaulis sp.]MDZ4691343.1 type VI secretion system-associated FHA domain protein [Terricaulis sp.]
MVTLRLFHTADPFRPIDTRTLLDGELQVGRDPLADWPVDDVACELSRRHCAIGIKDQSLYVRDLSSNGVFVGDGRRRIDRDAETLVAFGEAIHLGQFLIVGEAPVADNDSSGASIDAPFHAPLLEEPALSDTDFAVQSKWSSEAPRKAGVQMPDAPLLEAFCEGAGLDPSMFAGEEPTEVLRRAGSVYQQAVLGLSDLMSDRTSLKSELSMNRTIVAAANNNPFKWAEAHRVAVDLLRSGNSPFLPGASAVNESFQDLKKHLLCLMAGSRAAVQAAFDSVAPDQVEAAAKGQSHLLKTKGEACWGQFEKLHAAAVDDAHKNAGSAVNSAFKAGYERHVRRLEGLGTQV